MKLLLISASPRKLKSQTYALAQEVVKGCGQAEVKTIHLCDKKIEFCRHCEVCHKKILKCPIKDDAMAIVQDMLDADAIILASPNYINQVTGSMKTLFDRSSHFIHCKRLLDKYIVGVVTSGSGQDQTVLDYIKYYANTCGAQYAGGVSCRVPVSEDKKTEARNSGKSLIEVIKNKTQFPEQIKDIDAGREHFKRIIAMRKDEWEEEYRWWRDKGWL